MGERLNSIQAKHNDRWIATYLHALYSVQIMQILKKIDRLTVLLAAIGGAGSMLLLLRMATYGVGIGGDATLYISTAQNLAAGEGFIDYTGTPYAAGSAAPLYPVTLWIITSLGFNIFEVAKWVNAVAFGLLIFVTAIWLKSLIHSRFVIVCASCTCALSTSLAEVSAYAQTDILFTLFSIISLLYLNNFLKYNKSYLLVIAALGAACAFLYRYIGVTLVGSGILVILIRKGVPLRIRLANSAVWLVVTTFPFGMWMLRNILATGPALGRLYPDEFSLLDSLHNATSEVGLWIFGVTGLGFLNDQLYRLTGVSIIGYPTVASIALKTAILTYSIVGAYALVRRYMPHILSSLVEKNRSTWIVSLPYIALYTIFLSLVLPFGNIVLPVRYLIPLYPLVLIIISIILDEILMRKSSTEAITGNYKNKLISMIIYISTILWLMSWIVPNYNSIKSWNYNGRSFSSKTWSESETLALIGSTVPSSSIIWSNNHAALYYLPGYSNIKVYRLPLDLAEAKAEIIDRRTASAPNYVVWFYSEAFEMLPSYSVEALGSSFKMRVVAILPDGIILEHDMNQPPVPWQDNHILRFLLSDTDSIAYPQFDIYMDHQHRRLIYIKKECTIDDLKTKFIIRFLPMNRTGYPSSSVSLNESVEFTFGHFSILIGDHCVAFMPFPKYEYHSIKFGQKEGQDKVWKSEIVFN